jgi:hypothetical protein
VGKGAFAPCPSLQRLQKQKGRWWGTLALCRPYGWLPHPVYARSIFDNVYSFIAQRLHHQFNVFGHSQR